jgi:two-component system chemotaxis sensor kinase CheA
MQVFPHPHADASTKMLEELLNAVSVRAMVEGVGAAVLADLTLLTNEAQRNEWIDLADALNSLRCSLDELTGKDADIALRSGLTDLTLLISNRTQRPLFPLAPSGAAFEGDAELVAEFLGEAREHLTSVESDLLTLAHDPRAMESIHAVFRAFHTIKGLAGFFGFPVMQAIAHEVETLLDLARNHKVTVDTAVVDLVLESSDFLLAEIASIDQVLDGAQLASHTDSRDLISRIQKLIPVGHNEATDAAYSYNSPAPAAADTIELEQSARKLSIESSLDRQPCHLTTAFPSPQGTTRGEASQREGCNDDLIAPLASSTPCTETPAFERSTLSSPDVKTSADKSVSTTETDLKISARTRDQKKQLVSGSVRVDTAKLDYLMDMVGELVVAQSMLRHSHALVDAKDSMAIEHLSNLARITAQVQQATMSIRMVSMAHLFQKIERVVHDLSRKAGKQVTLRMSGSHTELDKTVAEDLADPLLHMVRNSIDHGIETPSERAGSGKPPIATIVLAAYHQSGRIIVKVSDDGRGLNAQAILRKAVQQNIVSPGESLSDAEIYELIFAPGFSTAEAITAISGRGVGMDVVRRNIEKLRGSIETFSELGGGTTFLLKLPLTLAIIDGLVVGVGRNQYIIPLSVIREIFKPMPDMLSTLAGCGEMALVRGCLLPIIRLDHRLKVPSRIESPTEGLLVVIESENKLYCMLVDQLLGKQEVVIKSLGEAFQGVVGFSGCAVLSDGQVGLILDTDGIYRGRKR